MSISRILTVAVTFIIATLILANGLANPDVVHARNAVYTTWDGLYPSSTSEDSNIATFGSTCSLCHGDLAGGGGNPWNAYGWAMRVGGSDAAAMTAIEADDSDGDGVSNIDEINAGTQPGWTNGANNTIYFKDDSTTPNSPPPTGLTNLDAPSFPGAPTGVTATAGDTQADVSWTAPVDDGGSAILTYTVTTSPASVGPFVTADATPSATITGLTNGTSYTFTVAATTGIGTGLDSTASNSVTPIGVPGAPTGASASAGDSQASVTWTAPASDGGSAITSYTVFPNPADVAPVSSGTTNATVTGLTNGTTYTFTVTATNAAGEGPPSAASNGATPTGVPTAPLGVTAAGGDAQATVNWSVPSNDGGSSILDYTVTTSPADVGPVTTTGAPTNQLITGLTNGQAYTFTVTATNAIGTGPASAPSNSVSPSSSGTAPDAPTGASATAGDTQATVTWVAPASDGGSPILDYTVTSNPGGLTDTVAASPATVLGLTNGVAYTFTVTARNAIGTGPASAPSNSVTPNGVPGAPTSVSASGGDSEVSLTWVAPASDGGSAIIDYTVTTSPADVGPLTTAGATPSATITGLTNGQAYTFTVTAQNGNGNGPASEPSNSATPTAAATVPAAPTGVSGSPGDQLVQVSWTAPASDGGSPIISYTVYPNPADVAPVSSASTTTTVTGLTNGQPYTFTVTATNSVGEGPASAASGIATPQPLGGAVGGGPHGGYGATGGVDGGLPDQCAGCHRAHTAASQGQLLVASSPYALCLTCHNGTGSKLNVVDGVKIGLQYDAAVVSYDDDGTLRASVAPAANVWMSPGVGAAVSTIALRNGSGGPVTVTLAIGETLAGSNFTASDLSSLDGSWNDVAQTISVPAAVGSIFGTAYVDLTTNTGAAAVADDQLITSVTAADGSNNVALAIQSKVGSPNTDATLNGGGFAFMNGAAITSRHNADPADNSLNPWGYNTANTGQNTDALTSALQCSSCHNPHGNSNYRLLKETINSQPVVVRSYFSGSFVATEGARGLEAGAPADKYTADYYGSQGGGGAPTGGGGSISSLCGACHSAYPSIGAADGLTAGGTTHYRHTTEMPYTWWTNPQTGSPTDNPETQPGGGFDFTGFPALRLASNDFETDSIVTCLTCHRAHGTNATMSGWATSSTLGGLNPYEVSAAQTAISTSTLLFTDNRGMCQACHQWGQ